MGILVDYLSTKVDSQAIRWEEVARHNKKMEKLEEQKVKNEEQKTKWSAKEAELEYKTKLMKTKVELEADGFSKEAIRAMFPDLSPMYNMSSQI